MASTYLTHTNGSAATLSTKGTFSCWVKRSAAAGEQVLFTGNDSSNRDFVRFESTSILRTRGCAGAWDLQTTQVFRDVNAWYHIVVAVDTTQLTASNRIKVYVNGSQITSFSTSTYPSQNYALLGWSGNGKLQTLGRDGTNNAGYLNGTLSSVNWIDGTALTPAYFGSTDSNTGIWTPEATSTISDYGTNGFKLKMDTTTPGADTSGKGNNFTVSGGTPTLTQGSPSNNWCTMNPLDVTKGAGTTVYTNGNTTVSISNSERNASRSSVSFTTGKFYAECKVISVGGDVRIGVMGIDGTVAQPVNFGDNTNPFYFEYGYSYRTSGQKENNNSSSSYGASYTAGNIIGVAFDATNGSITFYKDGATQGVAFSSLSSNTWAFYCTLLGVNQVSWNFGEGFFGTTAAGTQADDNGQGLFAYDVPAGYYALNTKNLEAYG